MDRELSNLTGGLALRGVVATLFGMAAVFWPGETLVTLLYLFATFMLVGGVFELIYGIGRFAAPNVPLLMRVVTPLVGLLQMAVGVYMLRHPHITFTTLILLIGFVLIVRGILEIVSGLFDEGPSMFRAVMVVVGLLAMLAGVLVLFQPASAGVAFVWIVGLYALVVGPLLLATAFETHRLAHEADSVRPARR